MQYEALTPRSLTVFVKPWTYGTNSFKNWLRTPEWSRARTRAARAPPPPPSAARIAESPAFCDANAKKPQKLEMIRKSSSGAEDTNVRGIARDGNGWNNQK